MESLSALEQLDETVHGRVRLGVLAYLSTAGSADFMTLADATKSTKGNLSSHITRLEDAGYVTIEKTFVNRKTRTTITMTANGEQAFTHYISILRSILNQIPSGV